MKAADTIEGIIGRLEDLDDHLTIYVPASAELSLSTQVVLIDEETEESPGGMEYFLEIHLAKAVLDVWRSGRPGRDPSPEEARQALSYYATRDAYLPDESATGPGGPALLPEVSTAKRQPNQSH